MISPPVYLLTKKKGGDYPQASELLIKYQLQWILFLG